MNSQKKINDLVNITYEVLENNLDIMEAIKLAYNYGKYESNELGKINQLIDKLNASDQVVHNIYSIAQRIVLRG
jgi:hypothetical protein